MSSQKKELESMSVRIDNEVVEWITTLKEMFKASNMSDAIRLGLLHGFPDLPEVTAEARQKESERIEVLEQYAKRTIK